MNQPDKTLFSKRQGPLKTGTLAAFKRKRSLSPLCHFMQMPKQPETGHVSSGGQGVSARASESVFTKSGHTIDQLFAGLRGEKTRF